MTFAVLLVSGLVLRLAGLLFNGVYDIDQFVFSWGSAVHREGLAKAFAENYGPFSYACFGWAAAAAEAMPRFWWLPYKAMEIGFELALLAALWAVIPAGRKQWALWGFWLNPWFILHGAFQGFWEGAYTLSAPLAALAGGWAAAGALLAVGALFKPQALFYFIVPVSVYLLLALRKDGVRGLLAWCAGGLGVAVLTAAYLMTGGASWRAIPANYLSVVRVMPNLCNECINVWRPVTAAWMAALGQTGLTTQLKAPAAAVMLLHAASFAAVIALMALFAARWARQPLSNAWRIYLSCALGALAVPMLATKAHINHGYAGVLLMVPLAARERRFFLPWLGMTGVHLYAHLAFFGLGRVQATDALPADYPWGRGLLLRIAERFPATDGLLAFQSHADALLAHLPKEPLISVLSLAQSGLTLLLLYRLWRWTPAGELA